MPRKMEVHREQGTTCMLLRATLLRGGPAITGVLPEVPAGHVRSCRKATQTHVPQLRNTAFHLYSHHGNPAPSPRQPAQTTAATLQV